ncbi:uncharacterized protein LOC34619097 [Cyclospora cayetanensis]|uniref:Uncharacterized protein n=2 Tax=Cyclospora cayetanensis TaxID=88456 RepID=A0A1D3D1T2_9EIME|nr:uncharacterized protein LOC34619097 [Cyclospora cayetanensis]OEH77397.1 hypothetical protein cyc_02213 [Cyclospora cayetanensis]
MGDCELLRRACPRSFIAPFLQRRVRPDGRRPSEVRSAEIVAGGPYEGARQSEGCPGSAPPRPPLAAAHASSSVRAGADWWFAAVECKLGPPVPLPPRNGSPHGECGSGGRVVVVVDMPRICGCSQDDTVGTSREVSRHLTALLNDPSVFDCGQLQFPGHPAAAVEADPGCGDNHNNSSSSIKFYWHLEVRVVCLQFGGSLFRAPTLAAVAALGALRIPDVEWDPQKKWWSLLPPSSDLREDQTGEGGELVVVRGHKVVLHALPVCVTACQVLHNTWVIDPTQEERQLGPLVGLVSPAQGAPLSVHKLQGGPLDALLLQQLQLAAASAIDETRNQLAKAILG